MVDSIVLATLPGYISQQVPASFRCAIFFRSIEPALGFASACSPRNLRHPYCRSIRIRGRGVGGPFPSCLPPPPARRRQPFPLRKKTFLSITSSAINQTMLLNTVSVSAPVPCTVLATAQSARYAALAVHLMYPKTRRDSRSRRSVRIRPSPLGRFTVWTPATVEVLGTSISLPALAAAPCQHPRSRAALGIGHPSRSSKRENAPVDPVLSDSTEPAASRNHATLGLGRPSGPPKSRVVSAAVVALNTIPIRSRATLGLGHPSTASKRLSTPLAPPSASMPYASPRRVTAAPRLDSGNRRNPQGAPLLPLARDHPAPAPRTRTHTLLQNTHPNQPPADASPLPPALPAARRSSLVARCRRYLRWRSGRRRLDLRRRG
ncbi:hypothetical protein DFH06DRAFT_577216 [Mycena polygramma]|nr:hypothetical protein DFH06DRAFT_577216 [Mycena polygramma]